MREHDLAAPGGDPHAGGEPSDGSGTSMFRNGGTRKALRERVADSTTEASRTILSSGPPGASRRWFPGVLPPFRHRGTLRYALELRLAVVGKGHSLLGRALLQGSGKRSWNVPELDPLGPVWSVKPCAAPGNADGTVLLGVRALGRGGWERRGDALVLRRRLTRFVLAE